MKQEHDSGYMTEMDAEAESILIRKESGDRLPSDLNRIRACPLQQKERLMIF